MPVLLESAELIAQTGDAILVEFDDGSSTPEEGVNRFWIPKSVIESGLDELEEIGDIADLEVRTWFVDKTDGLEVFAAENWSDP